MLSATLAFAPVGQQNPSQTGAIVIAVVFVLLGISGLWLTWRMRLKKRRVQTLLAQQQAILDRQFAELQAMRAVAERQIEPHEQQDDRASPEPGREPGSSPL